MHAAVLAWRTAEIASEHSGEVGRVFKSHGYTHLSDRKLGFQKKLLCFLQAQLSLEAERRRSRSSRKGAGEMEYARVAQPGKLKKCEVCLRVSVNQIDGRLQSCVPGMPGTLSMQMACLKTSAAITIWTAQTTNTPIYVGPANSYSGAVRSTVFSLTTILSDAEIPMEHRAPRQLLVCKGEFRRYHPQFSFSPTRAED